MKRVFAILLAMVLVSGVGPSGPLLAGFSPDAAQAQQRQQGRQINLLDLLFGGGLRKQMQNRQNRPEVRIERIQRPQATSSGGGGVQPAPKTIVEKSSDAANILVAGDFMASGLQWGLEQAYSENPNVVFIDKGSGLSGLVRDDVLDWPSKISDYIEEFKPVAVIVLVGMNDRQQMRLPDGRVDKLSDPWKQAYHERIEKLVKAVRGRNLPLIWLGLPPVKSGRMNTDYLVFNGFYREKVEAAGGVFVDVWDGYTNAEGAFVSAGPDINGQIVRLRNSDGINMTRAGMRKLAFYARKEIRKATGIGEGTVVAALPGLEGETITTPEYDPVGSGQTITISLDSPQADGGNELEGGVDFMKHAGAEKSNSHDLVVGGTAAKPHEGRIDAGWGAAAREDKSPEKQLEEEKPDNAERSDVPESSSGKKERTARVTVTSPAGSSGRQVPSTN